MQLGTIGGAVLVATAPEEKLGVTVNPPDFLPVIAAIIAAEQSLRRGSCVPDIRRGGMSRRQPEHMVHAALALLCSHFGKSRWFCRLFPGLAGILGYKNRRAKMATADRHQAPSRMTGIGYVMTDNCSQMPGSLNMPGIAAAFTTESPGALAGTNQKGFLAHLQRPHNCYLRTTVPELPSGIGRPNNNGIDSQMQQYLT